MLYAYIKVLCYLNGISWWLYLGNLKRSCYVIVVDVSYISYALIDILQPHMQSYKPLVELYEGKTIYLYDMKFYVDSYNLRPVFILLSVLLVFTILFYPSSVKACYFTGIKDLLFLYLTDFSSSSNFHINLQLETFKIELVENPASLGWNVAHNTHVSSKCRYSPNQTVWRLGT